MYNLEKLFNTFPNEKWDIDRLSKNKNITRAMIERLRDKFDFNHFYNMLNSPNIDKGHIYSHMGKYIHPLYEGSSNGISISLRLSLYAPWSLIKGNIHSKLWIWNVIILYRYFNYEITDDTINFIEKHHRTSILGGYWKPLSEKAPIKYIIDHPNFPWNWYIILESNRSFQFEHIKYIPRYICDDEIYNILSDHPNITVDIIYQHPELPWNYRKFIGYNYSFTWDKLRQFSRYSLFLSKDPIDTVMNKLYDNNKLLSILNNKDYLRLYSSNPNVTAELVINNPEFPWDFQLLSENNFNIGAHHYAKKIQRAWKRYKNK